MIHIGLGGALLLLTIIICCGGPRAVLRALAGLGCLILILAGLIALLCAIGSVVITEDGSRSANQNSVVSSARDNQIRANNEKVFARLGLGASR
jgi:hypothetical protein